jgi:HTH-type transcriptional regulator/antitoxin HipB
MRTLQELGAAIAVERRALRLKQKDVALQAGITPESLLRFERGQVSEFGSRKLLAVLAVLWYGSDLRKIGHVRLPR